MQIKLTHFFDTGLAEFERLMNDPDIIAEQVRQMRHVLERRVTHLSEEGNDIHRTVEFVMKQKLPGGGHMKMTETSVYDKTTKQFRYTTTPSTFAKLIDCTGTYTLFPDGPDRTRREIEISVKVKVPGMEKLLEPMMTKSLTKNMDVETAVFHEVIAQQRGAVKKESDDGTAGTHEE